MSATIEALTPKKSVSQHEKKSYLGIRGRLVLGFSAITLIFLISIGVTLSVVSSTKNFTTHVLKVTLPAYDALLDLNSHIYETESYVQMWLITTNPIYKTKFQETWNEILQRENSINEMAQTWDNDHYINVWNEVKNILVPLRLAQEKIINIDKTDNVMDMNAINILNAEIVPMTQKIDELLNSKINDQSKLGLLDIQSKDIKQESKKIISNLTMLQSLEYAITIIGIIAAIFISFLTSRAILRHVDIFRQHSSRIAAGDLTQFISVENDDELGQLGIDLNTMTKSLATITKKITHDCHNMVSTLDEVKHAVDAQSSGASEQASSVNEITASITEIEKSTNQTMEKAKTLGAAAEKTREKGQMGLDAVEQSVQGMKVVRDKVQMIAQTILDLSNQTQQVGEITAVVNNLAQQSKMLALNASIEAAKAGEAGRGFSVVAIEVKNLAEQSEQSTAQVQKILEDIRHATEKAVMVTEEGTKGVDHGTNLVEQTGEIIRSLNDVIHETTIATQQIEAAIRQETAGIEQITAGMNEINQVTSSFVESVNQTTEAIKNLETIAKNLKLYVDTYRI